MDKLGMESLRRRKNEENLYQAGETMTELSCTKCDTVQTFWEDSYYAAPVAYDEGWRATDKNVYCPACADKFGIK